MFDARMRVDSIRLFVFMDTVSRHELISLKMANEEDVLLDQSENVIEAKSTPKRKGNKVRTRRWTDEETYIRECAKTNQKKSGQGDLLGQTSVFNSSYQSWKKQRLA